MESSWSIGLGCSVPVIAIVAQGTPSGQRTVSGRAVQAARRRRPEQHDRPSRRRAAAVARPPRQHRLFRYFAGRRRTPPPNRAPARAVSGRSPSRRRRPRTFLRRPGARRRPGRLRRTFGTQWVVWVGGIALALGGIFLVRYSIEQGLFGPGLRVLFGAILAAALVGLANWRGAGDHRRHRRPADARTSRAS